MADTKKQNGETKSEAFKRLAEARTGKAIESVLRIGNLANKRNYEYRDEDVKKIITALKRRIQWAIDWLMPICFNSIFI